jgi:hypothetical protein
MRLFRIAMLALGVLGTVTTASGCYPIKLSPECRGAISACLASCEGQGGVSAPALAPGIGEGAVYPSDHRSDCEAACQSSCSK